MTKSQTTTNKYLFTFTFLYGKIYFVRKHIWKILVFIVTFALQFFCSAGYWKCNSKTLMPICVGLVDTALRPKILGNRLGRKGLLFIFYVYFRELPPV